MTGSFVWEDAGRTVVFQPEGVADAVQLLGDRGFARFELLSTPRAIAAAPGLAAAAASVHEVAPGQIPDLAAALLDRVHKGRRASDVQMVDVSGPSAGFSLVALGGGRVIDVAKAIAAVSGARVAAIPTTMSGAEMTAIHRLPAGAESQVAALVRPALVIADPEAMTSQPEAQLRASSMNALAHGADSLYTPFANPVSEMAALRGANLIATSLDRGPVGRDRSALALGSLLCGYAIDSAKFGLHHVICQTLVRVCGSPHAETNAAILPRALAFLAARAPGQFTTLANAVGTDRDGLEPRILDLGAHPAGLGSQGADRTRLDQAIGAMLQRPELTFVPGPSLSGEDLAEIVDRAW